MILIFHLQRKKHGSNPKPPLVKEAHMLRKWNSNRQKKSNLCSTYYLADLVRAVPLLKGVADKKYSIVRCPTKEFLKD